MLVLVAGCDLDSGASELRLEIAAPADGATVARASIDVRGSVWSADGAVAVVATAGEARRSCDVRNGTFLCSDVPLTPGTNHITVSATDDAGGRVSRTVAVVRSMDEPTKPEPVLDVESPTNGVTVDAATVDVRGSVTGATEPLTIEATTDHGARTSCEVDGQRFACLAVPLTTGANEVTVVAVDAAGQTLRRSFTVHREDVEADADFAIQLVFFDEDFTETQRAAFLEAAATWSQVITNDLQDIAVQMGFSEACGQGEPAFSGTIDDLLIFVTSFTQGEGGVLGLASPCRTRSSGVDVGTNAIGYMEFDTADLDLLHASGQLVDTIAHEMGHVLGIGTNWEDNYHDLLRYRTSDDQPCYFASGFLEPPHYIGAGGRTGYAEIGGSGDVPVEDEGGTGTQCGHWDEETFGSELMTGFLDQGDNPLSVVTILSLTDIGFDVDTSRAEPFTLPAARALRSADAFPIGERETILPPRGGIDPTTGEMVPAAPRR